MSPADPVARPAIDPASAPVPPPDPSARPDLRRFTMDLPTESHHALRTWSLEARVPASSLARVDRKSSDAAHALDIALTFQIRIDPRDSIGVDRQLQCKVAYCRQLLSGTDLPTVNRQTQLVLDLHIDRYLAV